MEKLETTEQKTSSPNTMDVLEKPTKNNVSPYELMIIVPATVSDEDIVNVKAKIGKIVAEHGAAISEEEDLGKRKLAYPINHIRQGFYHLYKFDAPTNRINKLHQELQLMPEILRHLITVRTVRTQAQLDAQAALRERIQAKRAVAEERAVADRHTQEAAERMERVAKAQPAREVSKEELDKKLEEILTDETLGE